MDRYSLETSRSKFYAGGDLITGASNVSNAMGYGKKAARNINQRLMGPGRWDNIWPQFAYSNEPPEEPSQTPRHKTGELPAADRAESFAEATVGLSAGEAFEEAGRCLRCDIKDHH